MLMENQEIKIDTKYAQRIDAHNMYRRQIVLVDECGNKTPVYACSLQTYTYATGDDETSVVCNTRIVECDTYDCKKCVLATPHYQGGV